MPAVTGTEPQVQKARRRRRARTDDFCLATCSVVGIVLVWSRLANLGTSFWTDEAYSAYYYANRGPHAIFFDKYVPNNHALYNLLSWATTSALGRFEAAYRLWSVLPGLAAVALAAWWLWKRFGAIAATAVVVFATISPVHLVLVPQARGYGLAMFAGLLMLIGAVRASDHGSTRDIVLFSIGALVGIWTLPVFALAAVAQAIVLLCDRRLRRRMLNACGVIAGASLVFYAPMLSGILHNAHQKFGAQLGVTGILTGAYHDLAAPTIYNGTPTNPHALLNQVVTFVVIMLLAITAVVRLWRRNDRALVAHLLVPVFGTYFALVVGRFYVQPRFASYLLFHVLVLFAIGVQQLWNMAARVTPARAIAAVLIVGIAVTGTSRVATLTKDEAHVPWENDQFVANLAKSTGLNYVFTDSRHPVALYYYLGADHVRLLREAGVEKQTYCTIPSRFIFVDDTYHQQAVPDLKCLHDRRAIRIQVPQQVAPPIRRPGSLTVYLVPAKPKKKPVRKTTGPAKAKKKKPAKATKAKKSASS